MHNEHKITQSKHYENPNPYPHAHRHLCPGSDHHPVRSELGQQHYLHHQQQLRVLNMAITNPADKVEKWDITRLIPYARNSRTHSDEQIGQIAASIKEWGWTTPVLVDEAGSIIAGHGRTLAAQRLKMTEVPVMVASGWSDAKKRAYIIADNKLALNAGWDESMLELELGELKDLGFNLELTGFSKDDIASLVPADQDDTGEFESKYTKKIDAPIYQPTGDCPEITDLYDQTKYLQLVEQINKENTLFYDLKEFLLAAASRHIRFDFEQIAELYAHASPEIQQLMEDSALVIIDFDKAISGGYVKLSQAMGKVYASEKGGDQ
jgi:hypothetical protein